MLRLWAVSAWLMLTIGWPISVSSTQSPSRPLTDPTLALPSAADFHCRRSDPVVGESGTARQDCRATAGRSAESSGDRKPADDRPSLHGHREAPGSQVV
jgi:hypothetical protein